MLPAERQEMLLSLKARESRTERLALSCPTRFGAGEYGFLPPGAFGSANSASIGTSLGKKTESILDSRPRLFIPTSVRGSPPMIEYVSVISVSVLLEFFLN